MAQTDTNTFSFMSVPDMILNIKSAVAKATSEEKVRLGLEEEMVEKTLKKEEISKKKEANARNDEVFRPPFSQIKLKPTYNNTSTTEINSEKMTDDELVEMTLTAIESSLRQKWQKLSDIQKRDRIKSFAERKVMELNISTENITPLFEQLRLKMLVEKSLKTADFVYDEHRGEIMNIPCLEWNPECHQFAVTKLRPKVTQDSSAIQSKREIVGEVSSNAPQNTKTPSLHKKPQSNRKVLTNLIKTTSKFR